MLKYFPFQILEHTKIARKNNISYMHIFDTHLTFSYIMCEHFAIIDILHSHTKKIFFSDLGV